MTSNARRYETSHKRNDFVNIKTTVGTSIARPLLLLQYLYNNYQIWYNSIELRLRGVTITVGGLPFFQEGVCFCPLSFITKEGDMMYITVTELFLFASLIVSIISLIVSLYNSK